MTKHCPECGGASEPTGREAFVEIGEWNGKYFDEELDACEYECLICHKAFYSAEK
jgi:hypothetical protein